MKLAAEKTGRRGYGIELDPYYVDTIIKRLSDVFGLEAELAGRRLSFEGVEKRRGLDARFAHAMN
ncbi:MAG: hypothetical protein KGJ49_01460 [Alphaproteobacteria bacterium]|nr:hypothetical protein [Alphaproteobacteria bacterium]